MNLFFPLADLQAARRRLGPLHTLHLPGPGLAEMHRQLGEEVRPQAQSILARRLEALNVAGALPERLRLLRRSWLLAQEKAARLQGRSLPVLRRVGAALAEYLDCLSAWAQGAGLAGGPADRDGIELALLLQDDLSGCQTGVYRLADGSVMNLPGCAQVEVRPGEAILSTSCGGGYGDPTKRPIDMVHEDVLEGFVTIKRAREVYKVEISADGAVDEEGTKHLRKE